MITELSIENFKSFGPCLRPLELAKLNCVVGANASGKTNLMSALRFLKIALLQNVDIALAEFEGISEVRNKIQRERKAVKPLRISVRVDAAKFDKTRANVARGRRAKEFFYKVEMDLRATDEIPVILSEELKAQYFGDDDEILTFQMNRTKEAVTIKDPVFGHAPKDPFPIPAHDSTRLAAGTGFFSIPLAQFRNYVEGWSFFNISPDVARLPCKEVPDMNLGASGEYLAAILHKLEKANNGHISLEQVSNGLRGAVPGFKSIKTKPLEVEGKWTFQVIEDRIRGAINPRSVSDGTIRLIALMVVTHWSAPRSTLLAIEEPENGLHPHLSKHVMDLLRTASTTRQVIMTTHNPDFLDELNPDEVLLCDKIEGFTKVRHASDVQDIEGFRKHFRLGELWEQGTLGGIP